MAKLVSEPRSPSVEQPILQENSAPSGATVAWGAVLVALLVIGAIVLVAGTFHS